MKNLHLIQTDNPSKLYYSTSMGGYNLKLSEIPKPKSSEVIPKNIYITSDEEIKENDYVIVSCSEVNIEEVRIVTGYYNEQFLFDDKSQIHMDYCKKIVLTTDQDLIADGVQSIDDDFLEWFCSKNGEIDFVKIITIENEKTNVLPDDVFNKSLEELPEKEYPKLIVENPSCNGYNEPNHIDINEECRNAFMEGVKSDKAKDYWFDIFKKNKEKWNKVTEDTPPSNVELLVKSPNGIIHLSRWRESYNIFGCQAKSESIVGWKWKKI
jgi:hypothetical protein